MQPNPLPCAAGLKRKTADMNGTAPVWRDARRWMLVLAMGCTVLLAACSQKDLYSKLTEQQANEMVAALRVAGLPAEKEAREGGKSFAVTTSGQDFPRAVEVLKAGGYPKKTHLDFVQINPKTGFVTTPTEERGRFAYILQQEIAGTLSSIDGVVQARVHVSIPEKDHLSDKVVPATASVFIKHRADLDMNAQVGQIKGIVVNAIEGLPYENVTVALFKADPLPPVASPAKSTDAMDQLKLALAGVVALGVLVIAFAVWVWLRQRRQTKLSQTGQQVVTVRGEPLDNLR